MHPFVQVFILSHNRVEYIQECIDAALSQNYCNFEVILSDNSDDDRVERATARYRENPLFKYIRRSPSLSASEHFNTLLTEPTGDFFMLFHDDDLLLPWAISKAVDIFKKNPQLTAVGGNAFFIVGKQKTSQIFSRDLKRDTLVSNTDRFVYAYIRKNRDYPPFPSYVYKTKEIKNLQINIRQGGRYADISFLAQVGKIGSLYWIKDPIMYYRIHEANDSATVHLHDILSLCAFFYKESPSNKNLIYHYKLKQYAVWTYQRLRGKTQGLSPWRDFIIMKSVFFFFLKHPLTFALYALRLRPIRKK